MRSVQDKKNKKMRKLSVYSWWAYSLDYALYGSVPLTSKGQESRGREGKERRGGQGFCVSSPESSFSNEAQSATLGSFVRELCVSVAVCVCVCGRFTDLSNKKQKFETLNIHTQFFETQCDHKSIQCKCSVGRPWNFTEKLFLNLPKSQSGRGK